MVVPLFQVDEQNHLIHIFLESLTVWYPQHSVRNECGQRPHWSFTVAPYSGNAPALSRFLSFSQIHPDADYTMFLHTLGTLVQKFCSLLCNEPTSGLSVETTSETSILCHDADWFSF